MRGAAADGAEEPRATYDVQRETQTRRQELARETAIADMQAEVVRSEQAVRIANQQALAEVEGARGRGATARIMAEAEAEAVRVRADAEAQAIRLTGVARADAHQSGIAAVGAEGYVALQIATTLGEHKVKLVPDIAVQNGDGKGGGLADVLIARMLAGAPRA